MWTNSMLKENAKSVLKNFYWMAVLALVIVSVVSGVANNIPNWVSGTPSAASSVTQAIDAAKDGEISDSEMQAIQAASAASSGVGSVLGSIISIAITFFVINPLGVGTCKFFIEARSGSVEIGNLFYAFRKEHYLNIVKTLAIMTVKIFLWSLLFIIPGIVKGYAYCLTPYILAENPIIDSKRAMEISEQTMNGEKMNFFVLQLSFIGWWILVLFTCGLGSYFLNPYIKATETEFFMCMKAKANSSNIAQYGELPEAGFAGGMGGFDPNAGFNPNAGFQNNGYDPNAGYNPNAGFQNIPYDPNAGMGSVDPYNQTPVQPQNDSFDDQNNNNDNFNQ